MGAETTDHSIIAIIAFEAAVPFWFGIGFAIWRLLEIASGLSVAAIDWAIPISLILTGVVYIPVSLYLRVLTCAHGRHRSTTRLRAGAAGWRESSPERLAPRTALFAFGSQALGAPISSWEDVTRVGVAIFLVGLAIAGIYFWSARSERLLTAAPIRSARGNSGAERPARADRRTNPR